MNDIAHLRSEIDRLDKTLVEILAERFKITHQIGLLKKSTNLPPVDVLREEQQLKTIIQLAQDTGLR